MATFLSQEKLPLEIITALKVYSKDISSYVYASLKLEKKNLSGSTHVENKERKRKRLRKKLEWHCEPLLLADQHRSPNFVSRHAIFFFQQAESGDYRRWLAENGGRERKEKDTDV